MKLGKLKEIDIRNVWAHEQYDFSKWLAGESNIQELGNVLNLSLTNVETEKFTGAFRCDILCQDEFTGKTVLIENQLEPSNHDHLGKIITYASGLDAAIVIWIVLSAREEHASAIRWLNQHTDENVQFFLLEIHAYVIEDSVPAPVFTIVEKPNDFTRTVKNITQMGEAGSLKAMQREFWEQFNEVLTQRGEPFRKHSAPANYAYNVAAGLSGCHMTIELHKKKKYVEICLWIDNDKALYDSLYEQREEIENKLGFALEWMRIDNAKASAISTYIHGLDFQSHENYPYLMNEAISKAVKMRDTFKQYIG